MLHKTILRRTLFILFVVLILKKWKSYQAISFQYGLTPISISASVNCLDALYFHLRGCICLNGCYFAYMRHSLTSPSGATWETDQPKWDDLKEWPAQVGRPEDWPAQVGRPERLTSPSGTTWETDQPKWGDLRDCLTSPSGATWNEKWATGKYLGHDIWYGFFTLYTGKSYKRMLYHTNHVISYKTGYIWLPDQPNWGVRIGFSDVLLSAFCLLILGS